MFRITGDPSSGSLVQYLAKITTIDLSCPLTWTMSVFWQHDRTIFVILATYCKRLPDDGSPVYLRIIYLYISWTIKCLYVPFVPYLLTL